MTPDGTQRRLDLPGWAEVSNTRRAHIARVVELLELWTREMAVSDQERQDWMDAGRWHDVLRDAPDAELRRWSGDARLEPEMMHGPAAAARLEAEGEVRTDVLEAIRFHTIGSPAWGRTGRALYMADFLEPGRPFARTDRAFLASKVPHDFDGVFRQVVRMRLDWALREGHALFAETVCLWNEVR